MNLSISSAWSRDIIFCWYMWFLSISFNEPHCRKMTKNYYKGNISLGYYLDKWTGPCTWAGGWLHLDKWLLCTWSSAPFNWPLDQVPSKIWSSYQISFNSITMGTSDQSVMSRKSRELIPRLFWAIMLVLIKLGKWQSTFWKAQEVLQRPILAKTHLRGV